MVSKSGKQATGVEKRSKKVAGIEKTAIKKLKNEVKSVKKKAKETNKIVDKKENGNGKEVVVAENKSILAKTSNKTPAIVVKNDVEIERTQISEEVIQEPVNKIINVVVTVSSRSESVPRTAVATSGSKADYQSYARQRCYAYGWSDNDFNCLVANINSSSP